MMNIKLKKLGKVTLALVLVVVSCTFGAVKENQVKAVEPVLSAGVNDDLLNSIITDGLTASAATPPSGSSLDWQLYLNSEWKSIQGEFAWANPSLLEKWSGAVSNIPASTSDTPDANPMVIPSVGAGNEYIVYYGEQLLYALENPSSYSGIKLQNDIDLNGYEKLWPGVSSTLSNFTIDGDGHSIYNIGSNKSFISTTSNCTIRNIVFDSAKFASSTEKLLGIVGRLQATTLSNVKVQNSLIFSAYATYNPMAGIESYVAPFGKSSGIIADGVATANNHIYAFAAHAGGAFAASDTSSIKNSHSIDSVVIASGSHSGGFISCANGGNTVENSFTNNMVYGNKETGVFIGTLVDNALGNDIFRNCYTSGSIEGQDSLGGFVGKIESFGSTTYSANFENCYSTSIVGMRNGGRKLGGFLGNTDSITKFTNCFAAGEVGAIDVDLSDGRISTVGGFYGVGNIHNLSFINTYYDKQTTAMREWESGATKDAIGSGAGELGIQNIVGLNGTLTSDSAKFGAGLASQPKTSYATGFTGFTGDVASSASVDIITNPNWIYDGGNTNSSLHNCMYPQLSVFYSSSDPLVRAFSYASVATVHEQVWQSCTHGDVLPKTTYDTVRDLTLRFTLTSYVDNPMETSDVDVSWEKSNATTTLYGKEKPVIGHFTKAENSVYNRKYWTADKFSPGTEWVTVKFRVKQDGQTVIGSRRLRIIPTSNITPGLDQIDLITGDEYNHALDMKMAYSTAQRLVSNDITTGVYPDAYPFLAGDERSTIQAQAPYGTDITNQFHLDDNKFTVGGEHLTNGTRWDNITHANNIVNVYLYDVKQFEEVPGKDTKIIYGSRDEAIISPETLNGAKGEERKRIAELWAKKLNGQLAFSQEDHGRYMIEYEWILPDGRFTRDSKMIMIQDKNHTVSTKVVNTDTLTPNKSSIMFSLDPFEAGTSVPLPTFTAASDVSSVEVQHFKPVNVAFKPVNNNVTVDKIEFEFNLSDISSSSKTQKVEIDNVMVDRSFTIPLEYYYSSYEENGSYYAKKVKTEKTYTLKKDVSGYFYLTLEQTFRDPNTGVERFDTECDVKATIFITDPDRNTKGNLDLSMETYENQNQVFLNHQFSYKVTNLSDHTETLIDLTSQANNHKKAIFTEGVYTIQQVNDEGYALDQVMVNGVEVMSPYSFHIAADEETTIAFTNRKSVEEPEPLPDPKPGSPDPVKPGDQDVNTGDMTQTMILTCLLIGSLYITIKTFKKLESHFKM